MPETKYKEYYQGGVLVSREPYIVPDWVLQQEQDERTVKQELLDKARFAFDNWDSLKAAQKDTFLRHLLLYVLWRGDR